MALICATLIAVAVAVTVGFLVNDDEPDPEGGPTASTAAPDASSLPPSAPSRTADLDVHAFGETERYADGIDVTVSEPRGFTPSDTAIGHTAGSRAVKLEVTVRNGSEAPLTLDAVVVQGRDAKGREVERVFDATQDLGAGLSGTLLPGRTAVGVYGFDLPEDTDGTLDLEVAVGFDRGPAFWSGKAP
ncbi:DUF4352 domain-containing protein [Streptomyces sp. NPDC047981]|uniref:DUF4352 domain-containing protein n=1 Tax=Streptomyces sp. NPDC047981 TaxID=3154610 RepID=UPI00343B2956